MPMAEAFHRRNDQWKNAGSRPHKHTLEPWYPHPGMPHEGYGCTVCGVGFDSEADAWRTRDAAQDESTTREADARTEQGRQ